MLITQEWIIDLKSYRENSTQKEVKANKTAFFIDVLKAEMSLWPHVELLIFLKNFGPFKNWYTPFVYDNKMHTLLWRFQGPISISKVWFSKLVFMVLCLECHVSKLDSKGFFQKFDKNQFEIRSILFDSNSIRGPPFHSKVRRHVLYDRLSPNLP